MLELSKIEALTNNKTELQWYLIGKWIFLKGFHKQISDISIELSQMWEFLRKLSYAACLPIEKLISMYTLEEICFWNYHSSRFERKIKNILQVGYQTIPNKRKTSNIRDTWNRKRWNLELLDTILEVFLPNKWWKWAKFKI